LDQLLLPHQSVFIDIVSLEDGWKAIREMRVRGAPAIAITGVLSLAVELNRCRSDLVALSWMDFLLKVSEWIGYLKTSRPTAVQLAQDCDGLLRALQTKFHSQRKEETNQAIEWVIDEADKLMRRDVEDNMKMGQLGGEDLISQWNQEPGRQRRVLTHCNTGSLATSAYGTALGVIRYLASKNQLKQVFCTETRPYNQGSRLTAYELCVDGLPKPTLLCDDMVASLMNSRDEDGYPMVDAVIVGADRLASNGDTANKIGTFQIALLAHHFGIPFMVVCPESTIDHSLPTGASIPIEHRSGDEVVRTKGWNAQTSEWQTVDVGVTLPELTVWNPAFDVTPSAYIDAIVTETQVYRKSKTETSFELRCRA
jgi:methylthioribose-1-phosphate isomerase